MLGAKGPLVGGPMVLDLGGQCGNGLGPMVLGANRPYTPMGADVLSSLGHADLTNLGSDHALGNIFLSSPSADISHPKLGPSASAMPIALWNLLFFFFFFEFFIILVNLGYKPVFRSIQR